MTKSTKPLFPADYDEIAVGMKFGVKEDYLKMAAANI